MLKGKKGYTITDMLPLALTFVVLAVAISIGAAVLDDIKDSGSFTANSDAYNATLKGLDSMETFGEWLPTLALVVVSAVIIGILIMALARKFM